MTVVTMAAAGLVAVLLAVQLKSVKNEYGIYLVMAAGLFMFLHGLGKMGVILDTLREIRAKIPVSQTYLDTLLKMVGITYVAEFSSAICKDAGYQTIAVQIEIFGKLAILVLSMPILTALLSTIQDFLS